MQDVPCISDILQKASRLGAIRFSTFLENRAVTRVLSEWWATLQPDQKRFYINLTQEYKDAFLNAMPDFKWYKLPALPLRTLNTRPTNKKQESGSGVESTDSVKSEYESSDCTKSDRRDGQSIQPGKLADELQISGLSSLLTPQKTEIPDEQTVNGIAMENDAVPKPSKKRYTELPFQNKSQKKDCKADLFGEKKRKIAESNNNEQHETIIEDEKHAIKSFVTQSEENSFRGERTCKGQKFLAEQIKNIGSSNQQGKRKRTTGSHGLEERPNERRNSISSNSEKTDSLSSKEGNSSRGELEHLVERDFNLEKKRSKLCYL